MKLSLCFLIITLSFSSLSQVISFEGEIVNYYENGAIREKGKMANGHKQGEWLSYYITSQLKERKNYINDTIYALYLYFVLTYILYGYNRYLEFGNDAISHLFFLHAA